MGAMDGVIVLNTLALIGYGWVTARWLRSKHTHSSVTWFLVAIQTWSLASSYVNDLGVYNPELFRHTSPSAATLVLACLYSVFNLTLHRMPARPVVLAGAPRIQAVTSFVAWSGLAALLLTVLTYSLGFVQQGIPIFTGMDRATFLAGAGGLHHQLIVRQPLLLAAAGFLWPTHRNVALGALALLAVFTAMAGHKFSGLLELVVWFFLTAVPTLAIRRIPLKPMAVMASIPVAATAVFYLRRDGALGAAFQSAFDRIFKEQGHIWWATFQANVVSGDRPVGHAAQEMAALLGQPHGVTGLQYLMLQALEGTGHESIAFGVYLYTMGFPAILLTMMPLWATPLIMVGVGALVAWLTVQIRHHCIQRDAVGAMLLVMALLPLTSTLFSGNLDALQLRTWTVKLFLWSLWIAFGHPWLSTLKLRNANPEPGAP